MSDLLQMNTMVDTFPRDQVVTLRYSLVRLCDNNHCAAILLDYFYEYSLYLTQIGRRDAYLLTSTTKLSKMMSRLFNQEEIYIALCILQDKKYIAFNCQMHEPSFENRGSNEIYVHYRVYHERIDAVIEELKAQDKAKLPPAQKPVLEPTTTPIQEYKREVPLSQQYKTETARVMYHNRRAEEYGLPATLTIEQWITTLNHFDWKCAYCQGKYTVLEHFTPLGYDQGTTATNCVPACHKCNGTKGPYHPKALPSKMQKKWGKILLEVQQYLETCREEEVVL